MMPNTVIVHGTDFLKPTEIMNLFAQFHNPLMVLKSIHCINRSNYCIRFHETAYLMNSLRKLLLNKGIDLEVMVAYRSVDRWFEIQPYEIFEIRRGMRVRYGTLTEMVAQHQDTSFLNAFEEAKEKMEPYFIRKYNCKKLFNNYKHLIKSQPSVKKL